MIPEIFHFILFTRNGECQLNILAFIAIKSAIEQNSPERVFLHCNKTPTGEYWERLSGSLTVNLTEIPEEAFGNPITQLSHAADVVRLKVLSEYGGIYLDLDTICVKPFPKKLFSKKCVMGLEKRPGFTYSGYCHGILKLILAGKLKSAFGRLLRFRKYKYVGLCNAVIMAEPGSMFIRKWIEGYRSFNSENWNFNSVIYPFKVLLPKYRFSYIKVVDHRYFFYPGYDEDGLNALFEDEMSTRNEFPKAIVHHLWATVAKKYLEDITEEKLCNSSSFYARIAKKYLQCK